MSFICTYVDAKPIVPTELGKDPNDVLVKAGADKLKGLIQGAVAYSEHKDKGRDNIKQ